MSHFQISLNVLSVEAGLLHKGRRKNVDKQD